MATRERTYTVDEVWRLANAPENEQNRYTLIDGELTVEMSPGYQRTRIASEIARLMGNFVTERDLGEVTVESGHYPQQDRRTLQLPMWHSSARSGRLRRTGIATCPSCQI